MKTRKQILESLIAFDRSLSEIQKDMATLDWDSEEYVTTLTRQDILSVLNRYLNKEFTAEEIRDWAEELDARQDYAREKGYQDLVIETIFNLSTEPWLGLPLTPEYAQQLIQEISSAQYDKSEDDEED